MRWLIWILFLLAVGAWAQQTEQDKDKTSAQNVFLKIDKTITVYNNIEMNRETRDSLSILPSLVCRNGLKVTKYSTEQKTVRGKTVTNTICKTNLLSLATITKVVQKKVKMIDDYLANPNNNKSYDMTDQDLLLDDLLGQYQYQKPEKFQPLRKAINIWAWPTLTTVYDKNKKPIPCQVTLVKENKSWKLAELVVVSDEGERKD